MRSRKLFIAIAVIAFLYMLVIALPTEACGYGGGCGGAIGILGCGG